jgi:hypothetical protein
MDHDPDFDIPGFSGDDFASDKEVLKHREQVAAYKKRIDDAVAIVKDELGLEACSHKNLKTFSMFSVLRPFLLSTFRARNSPLRLEMAVVEYTSSYPVHKAVNSGSDQYFFGYIEFSKTFPKSYILKESLHLKLTDLILQQDADFPEHKKFSSRFHVITQDSKLLQDRFLFKDLDQLAAFPDMEVEIHEHSCLFRNSRKCISNKEAEEFSGLAKSLVEIFK